ADRVTVREQDLRDFDYQGVTVVCLYLLPENIEALEPALAKLGKGARIVCHDYPLPGYKADQVVQFKAATREHTLYLFTLPRHAQKADLVLGKKCAEWLTMLKEHKEVKFRRAALIALEVFGPGTPGVLPGLCEALTRDAEPMIRRETALLLGRMGADAKEAVPHLTEAAKKDRDDAVREAAAEALKQVRP